MCIHPDDPLFSLYGLPCVVSTADDARFILGVVDSPANGLTFCTGSYGVRADNDLVAMIEEFAPTAPSTKRSIWKARPTWPK